MLSWLSMLDIPKALLENQSRHTYLSTALFVHLTELLFSFSKSFQFFHSAIASIAGKLLPL